MQGSGGGAIINFARRISQANMVAYNCAKAGIELSHAWRWKEGFGIRVNAVAPGLSMLHRTLPR
jgi:NAD(P)-dependent dehydrogenase (short-subunit alcohol dehydrogenase family)